MGGVKVGKLDNDDSNNSLDPSGGPFPEAPFSFRLSLSLFHAPSVLQSLSLPSPSLPSSLLLLFHS